MSKEKKQKEELVMEIDEAELARIKKVCYSGKAYHCYINTRAEFKGLIKLAEKYFEQNKKES